MRKATITILLLFICLISFSQTTELVTGMIDPGKMTLNNTHLYYTDDDSVYRIDISQTNAVPELLASGLNNPNGLAINGDELFIAEFSGGKISKLNINDANPQVVDVETGLNFPNVLMWYEDFLFWSNNTTGYVGALDFSVTPASIELIAIAPSNFVPFGIASYNSTTLYMANAYGNSIDVVDPTSGDETPQVFLSGFDQPFGLRIYQNKLYITEKNGGKVLYVDLSEENPVATELYSNLSEPIDIEVNEMGIFIMEQDPNRIILLESNLGQNEAELQEIAVHPIPSHDYITVSNILDDTEFEIFDSYGKMVKKGIIKSSSDSKIRIEEMENGIYFLSLKDTAPIKFIKH